MSNRTVKQAKHVFSMVVLVAVLVSMVYGIFALGNDAINATHDAIMLG